MAGGSAGAAILSQGSEGASVTFSLPGAAGSAGGTLSLSQSPHKAVEVAAAPPPPPPVTQEEEILLRKRRLEEEQRMERERQQKKKKKPIL